ncbi:MAG TPA: SRPBCC family protein [Jatrophihabitantaceae bacterium]|nr:SRPBCC family protein [Jatrophihabitantaceae bacterium]
MSPAEVVRVETRTDASPERVWQLLADPYTWAHWVAGTSAIRDADAHWPASGARLYHRFGPRPLAVRGHTTVVDVDPARRIGLLASALPYALVRIEITVAQAAGRTRVELCEQLVGGLGMRLPRLSRPVQLARNRRSLHRLIELAERGGR